jgi:hypothetical protein
MNEKPMTDTEVFAALCALPERFHFGVERRISSCTMDWERDQAIPNPASWFVVLSIGEDSEPSFSARAETLAEAWADVRQQIATFTKVL